MNASTILRKKLVGVLGINARPIAQSANLAGAEVYVSDYWGDLDLADASSKWVSVLKPTSGKRQRSKLKKPSREILVDNFLDSFSNVDFDYVIVGGGFDDHSELLKPIEKQWGFTGNSIALMQKSRKKEILRSKCIELGISMPLSHNVSSPENAVKIANDIGFPCLIRTIHSGGGGGIRFATDEDEITEFYDLLSQRQGLGVLIQEYISGLDVSASILSTGVESHTLSVQGQLIGIPSAGRNCDFIFCGNYYPAPVSQEKKEEIGLVSARLCDTLGLVGSNGLDYIIDGEGHIWLMEINPRIQASMEMLELAGDVSVLSMHVSAHQGNLPQKTPTFNPAVKIIAYSRKDGIVGDLSKHPSTVDRTPTGVIVKRGDPICSVIETGGSLEECYSRACSTVESISSEVRAVTLD